MNDSYFPNVRLTHSPRSYISLFSRPSSGIPPAKQSCRQHQRKTANGSHCAQEVENLPTVSNLAPIVRKRIHRPYLDLVVDGTSTSTVTSSAVITSAKDTSVSKNIPDLCR